MADWLAEWSEFAKLPEHLLLEGLSKLHVLISFYQLGYFPFRLTSVGVLLLADTFPERLRVSLT